MKRWLAAISALVCLGIARRPHRAENEQTVIALPADVMQFIGIYAPARRIWASGRTRGST